MPFAVVSRVPGGVWNLRAGPFETVAEATDIARRLLADTPRGAGIVGTCPWDDALDERVNVDLARGTGTIERVT